MKRILLIFLLALSFTGYAQLQLPYSVKLVNALPVDYYYGPWASVAAAKAGVPLAVRYDGLTVQVTGTGEYHWLAADLSDAGLVLKGSGSTPTLQQVLTSGNEITSNSKIRGDGSFKNLAIDSVGNFKINNFGYLDLRSNYYPIRASAKNGVDSAYFYLNYEQSYLLNANATDSTKIRLTPTSLNVKIDNDNGTTGEFLGSDGAGGVVWATPSGGGGGSGDVVGPASATDNLVATFDGTTGKLLKSTTTPFLSSATATTQAAYDNSTKVATTAYTERVLRNLSVYNLLDFGGVPDSTTDNRSAFIAAIAAMPVDGGKLVLPVGDYYVSDSVVIDKNIVIEGFGSAPFNFYSGVTNVFGNSKGATVIRTANTTKNLFVFTNSGSNPNPVRSLENLTIVNTASTPTAGSGVKLRHGGFSKMTNVTIKGFYVNLNIASGIFIDLMRCNFIDPKYVGIIVNSEFPDSGGVTIDKCYIIASRTTGRNPFAGIYYKGGGAFYINNSNINSGLNYTLPSTDGTQCFQYPFYADLSAGAGSDFIFSNSIIENYRETGIKFAQSTTFYNLQLANLTISPNMAGSDLSGVKWAIDIQNGDQVNITNITGLNALMGSISYPLIRLTSCANSSVSGVTFREFSSSLLLTTCTNTVSSSLDGINTLNSIQLTANSLSTGNGLNIETSSLSSGNLGRFYNYSTSTQHVAGTSGTLSVFSTGTNSGSSRSAIGVNSVVNNTGTSSTNIGGFFKASGATNNYGVIVPSSGGNSGFGTSSPTSLVEIAGSTTNSSLKVGSFEFQGYAVNNLWLGDNLYFDGTNYKYRANGYGSLFYFANGGAAIFSAPSSTAGSTATITNRFHVKESGEIDFNGSAGTSGQVLTSAGTGAPPTWTTPSGGALTIGTSTITSGTSGNFLYNNAGVLGERTPGTGVATWFQTPSWTNFQSAITGTAPYIALTGTSTFTGSALMTSSSSVTLTTTNNLNLGGANISLATDALTLNTTIGNDDTDTRILTQDASSGAVSYTTKATLGALTFNSQSGTTYTVALSDFPMKGIKMTNGSANTITLPLNATTAIPVGYMVTIIQDGAGLTSVTIPGGGTINGGTATLHSGGQYSEMVAIKYATDDWYLAGASGGKITYDATITAGGTTGNQTIDKPSGTVNIAAAGTTVTVTDSYCTTSSIVTAVIRTNDATAYIKNVVPGSGSFVINLGAAATAEISIGFIVSN